MKSNSARKIQKSSKPSPSTTGAMAIAWLVPLAIVLATWAAFLPILSNDFVAWDDEENLLDNPNFRGLEWSHLAWMFSTSYMGHYQPLSWLTLGLDYSLWGLNPLGYHLTSLLLHSANGFAFYCICRRLLSLAASRQDSADSWAVVAGAAFAAVLFALHPLRVESVAWATERRDVLSGLFFLWAIYAYLRAQADLAAPDDRSRRWMAAALVLYLCSLLSKAAGITFPVVLLLLDIYPLRRLTWNVRQWFAPEAGKVWREKIPFAILACLFGVIAILSQQQAAALKSLEDYGIGPRLAQAFYGTGFYLWKTLVPLGLSPLYQIPPGYSFWDAASLMVGAATLVISIGLLLLRNRWPAGLSCWLYYLTLLAPVLGLAQSGPQLVADRYSYLSCLGWAMLGGGLVVLLLRRAELERRASLVSATIGFGALAIGVGLPHLTWQQCAVWRNTETLWTRVLEVDPDSSYAHYNLARYLGSKGSYAEAMSHYRQALSIRPEDVDAHNNLGLLLALTGQVEAALAEFRRATEIAPGYAKGYFNLGRVLARSGEFDGAAENLRKALQLNPDQAEIHLALGNVLARQERLDQARERFEAAIRLKPDFADAHLAMARWFASQGDKNEAVRFYQEALRLKESQTGPGAPPRSGSASDPLQPSPAR